MRPLMFRLLLLGLAASAAPLRAGGPDGDASAAMIEKARQFYGVGRSVGSCGTTSASGEIVVCGRRKPPPRLDPVEPTVQPELKMIALGSPPIPLRPPSVTIRGCFLQKCPKDLYFIDLAAIPEGAPGTDADKISKGQMRER